MAQTKKKKTTKTTKKTTAVSKTHKRAASRTNCKKGNKEITNTERMHICFVTVLSIAAGILLCTDAAIIAASGV